MNKSYCLVAFTSGGIWQHLCCNCLLSSYPVCDIINFEIYHSFLIEPSSYLIKKSEQKLKYLRNEKSF